MFILRSVYALPYGRATALLPTAYRSLFLPTAVLAIVFRFFRSSFTSLPRVLERYELASILLDSKSVGAVIRAPVSASS